MPQETLVVQLAPAAQARLERELEGGAFEHRSVEHARFSVRGQGVIATLYRSGKLACAEGEACARPLPNKLVRFALIAATAIVIVAWLFNYIAPYVLS